MNEKTPETHDGKPASGRLSAGKIVAIAIGVTIVAGAAGIYARGMLSGNGAFLASASGGQCTAAIEAGKSLKPLLTGEVAAMANRIERSRDRLLAAFE